MVQSHEFRPEQEHAAFRAVRVLHHKSLHKFIRSAPISFCTIHRLAVWCGASRPAASKGRAFGWFLAFRLAASRVSLRRSFVRCLFCRPFARSFPRHSQHESRQFRKAESRAAQRSPMKGFERASVLLTGTVQVVLGVSIILRKKSSRDLFFDHPGTPHSIPHFVFPAESYAVCAQMSSGLRSEVEFLRVPIPQIVFRSKVPISKGYGPGSGTFVPGVGFSRRVWRLAESCWVAAFGGGMLENTLGGLRRVFEVWQRSGMSICVCVCVC